MIEGDRSTIERLAERLKKARGRPEYQRIQCVPLRATLGSSAAEIASVLGWAITTVHNIHSRWAREGDAIFALKRKGGRHHQHLTPEDEAGLLAPFMAGARAGGLLQVAQVQRAYEQRVGKPSTGYWIATAGAKWCRAQNTPRPMSRHRAPLKKLRPALRREIERQARLGRAVRLMFQDEGRFGLLGSPRRCWAPRGVRPTVGARLVRQFTYAFAAVSPHDGVMDSLILPWVNAHTMSLFLQTVARRHAREFIVMVMDQAGWHIAGDLVVPANMRLLFLPPYSPELNPAEHLWKALRQECFANTVFASPDAVQSALATGLRTLEKARRRTQSLTGFEWITSISLKRRPQL